MKIIVKYKTNGWWEAWLESDPSVTGIGTTDDAAVGNLVRHHPELFQVEVEVLNEMKAKAS